MSGEAKGFSLAIIFLAVALITLGRQWIRGGRRQGRRALKARGWMFVFLGFMLMLVGVVIW